MPISTPTAFSLILDVSNIGALLTLKVILTWRCLHLQWRHYGRDRVSNHQPHDCLLNRLLRHRSKKTSKLRVTGLCAGNSPATAEFPAQMASNAENVSIWWRHHDIKPPPDTMLPIEWDMSCMMTSSCWSLFRVTAAICEGNPAVTGGFPHKGQWRRAFNRANNRDAGDLRRHRGHYDVTVMFLQMFCAYRRFCTFLDLMTSFKMADYISRVFTACCLHLVLTHWGRNKMAAILQTIFSNAFRWKKTFQFHLCSLVSNWQYSNFGLFCGTGDKPLSEPMMI